MFVCVEGRAELGQEVRQTLIPMLMGDRQLSFMGTRCMRKNTGLGRDLGQALVPSTITYD